MDSSTSMDSILSRFSNFNTAMSQKANSQQDDDDDDEEEDNEGHQEENEDEDRDAIMKERDSQYQNVGELIRPGTPIFIPSVAKAEEPLVKDYVDNNYWKVPVFGEKSVEDLMAEMEI